MSQESSNSTTMVFVYGTLRPPRPQVPAEDSRYFPLVESYILNWSPGSLDNADLYDMGEFPGAAPGRNTIHGDLLTVGEDALVVMDRIEGHPTFFRREKVSVSVPSGRVEAWIYWAPDGLTHGRLPLAGGDWLRRREAGAQDAVQPEWDNAQVDEHLHKAVERLAAAGYGWLSSVRPDGRAYTAPAPAAWRRGRAYVCVEHDSETARNIASNPSVAFALPDPVHYLLLEGWATQARQIDLESLSELSTHQAKLGIGPRGEVLLLEITPTALFERHRTGYREWQGGEVMRVG